MNNQFQVCILQAASGKYRVSIDSCFSVAYASVAPSLSDLHLLLETCHKAKKKQTKRVGKCKVISANSNSDSFQAIKHLLICISCFASLPQKSYLAANIAGLNIRPDFFS